ncbi:MAG TPA: DsbA family protein [Longimicrobiales bacterium]|nr:DsbA family protein [Longimicrobiales bacterium]
MAKKKTQGGSNLKPFYIILGVVALLGAAAIGYGALRRPSAAVEPIDLSSLDARALYEKAKGVGLGDPAAPVQVLVFSDYMCPACAYFSTRSTPLLKQEFIDRGQVQLIYYDFPLGGTHVHSFVASRAARCAEDQGKFWEYHDMLLGRQQDWSYSREAPIGKFMGYARELGLEESRFGGCLRSDEHAELVSANHELGEQLGVNATPSVFVNSRKVSSPNDWDELRPAIQRELGN